MVTYGNAKLPVNILEKFCSSGMLIIVLDETKYINFTFEVKVFLIVPSVL